VVASVGATLRSLTYEGRDLVVPFAADEVRPFYRGAVLAPWPNRIIDGRWAAHGQEHQLPLTEPARRHALHGLALWLDFRERTASADETVLEAVVEPQDGYPYRLALEVSYLADAVHGLTWSLTATNLTARPAPHGCGPHPYLMAGPAPLDQWSLILPADLVIETDGPRLLPGAARSVDGSEFDFRERRAIGPTRMDHTFGGIRWEAGPERGPRRGRALVEDPSGTGVSIAWDEACPWLQVHTADRPEPELNRLGLAVEPMTCPPDAFNSGTDLVWLAPGASCRTEWTITGW
jgi:aldose 1-epimerase